MEWSPDHIVTVLTKDEMHAHYAVWFTARWVTMTFSGVLIAYGR